MDPIFADGAAKLRNHGVLLNQPERVSVRFSPLRRRKNNRRLTLKTPDRIPEVFSHCNLSVSVNKQRKQRGVDPDVSLVSVPSVFT